MNQDKDRKTSLTHLPLNKFVVGQPTMIAGGFGQTINITGEDFYKHVVMIKEGDSNAHAGTLVAPIKVGRGISVFLDDGRTWNTSTVQSIDGSTIKTKNSTYLVEYK